MQSLEAKQLETVKKYEELKHAYYKLKEEQKRVKAEGTLQ